jgi:hypothetical protein
MLMVIDDDDYYDDYCNAVGPTFQYSRLVLEVQTLLHHKVQIRLSKAEPRDLIQ